MKTRKLFILIITMTLMSVFASCASNAPRNVNYKRHRGRCSSCTKWTQNNRPALEKTFEMAFVGQE